MNIKLLNRFIIFFYVLLFLLKSSYASFFSSDPNFLTKADSTKEYFLFREDELIGDYIFSIIVKFKSTLGSTTRTCLGTTIKVSENYKYFVTAKNCLTYEKNILNLAKITSITFLYYNNGVKTKKSLNLGNKTGEYKLVLRETDSNGGTTDGYVDDGEIVSFRIADDKGKTVFPLFSSSKIKSIYSIIPNATPTFANGIKTWGLSKLLDNDNSNQIIYLIPQFTKNKKGIVVYLSTLDPNGLLVKKNSGSVPSNYKKFDSLYYNEFFLPGTNIANFDDYVKENTGAPLFLCTLNEGQYDHYDCSVVAINLGSMVIRNKFSASPPLILFGGFTTTPETSSSSSLLTQSKDDDLCELLRMNKSVFFRTSKGKNESLIVTYVSPGKNSDGSVSFKFNYSNLDSGTQDGLCTQSNSGYKLNIKNKNYNIEKDKNNQLFVKTNKTDNSIS